ncbi:MAG TPA: HD-GYP domain-containing protein [Candidatus Aminicenantes bacterium]|nr:HD-GYP domain-containing protein [Candidatus Aminicenantes bacterium]HRY65311.1 HD-GYP domain-containing protein [Candidatus Aminicenantes bacterium]HRZ72221.1 HD-GYP domain-containing protein [Candidatus Aminicenantes bacterium]
MDNRELPGGPAAGADPGARARQKAGLELLTRFHIVDKIAKIYDPGNDAFQTQGRLLFETLTAALAAEEEVSLRLRHGTLLLNGVRLKFGVGTYGMFKSVIEEFRARNLESVTFLRGLTIDELFEFMSVFAKREKTGADAFDGLKADVEAAGLEHFELEKLAAEEIPQGLHESSARLFFLSIVHLKESFARDRRNEPIKISTTRRLMQSIYNHIVEDEGFVYGLTNIKNHDEYTLNHSVNVCLLATALGRRLGLSRAELVDLGMAAFFHDLGKTETPLEILNKPGRLTDAERDIMERHPFHGAEKLALLKEFRRLPLRAIHVAMEHHIKEDLSGYPRYFKKDDINLFSKIVKVVDVFDAITTKRIYRAKTFTRAEALNLMLEQSGTEFNPVILKAFVNMLGVFPIGTLVALTTGEMAIVQDVNPDAKLVLRPTVKLITDSAGNKIDGEAVDLAERDPETGRFRRTIAAALDPGKYGIEVSDYFLSQAAGAARPEAGA